MASSPMPGDKVPGMGLNPDLPTTSSVTPMNPIARPNMREPPGRSWSHTQATKAPVSGTVALRIEVSPVVMCVTANANNTNGMPELSRPTNRIGFARCRKSAHTPLTRNTGKRNRAASATRTPAVGECAQFGDAQAQ